MAGGISTALGAKSIRGGQKLNDATQESPWVRRLVIGTGLFYFALFLLLPLSQPPLLTLKPSHVTVAFAIAAAIAHRCCCPSLMILLFLPLLLCCHQSLLPLPWMSPLSSLPPLP